MQSQDVKRIWILGDIHFGLRAASMEWFDITKSYFEDFFIPLLEKEYKEGDILIQLGDIFENRQTINLKFNSYTIELFERLSKILPVYAICGNHDIYFKRSNDITSLDSLRFLPNVNIYKEPIQLKFGEKECLLMPWRSGPKEEGKTLDEFPNADYVFCHSEMQGVWLNKKVENREGTRVSKFKNYKRVYSGHIHYSQKIKNVVMVGNAYQMTRSDFNNSKGVYLLDLKTDEHEYFENNMTPEFIKLNLSKMLEHTVGQIKEMTYNNFVDLYVPSELMIKYNVSQFINLIHEGPRQIDPNIYDEKTFIDIDDISEELQSGYKNFDVLNLCVKAIESMDHEDELKDRLKQKVQQLYTIATANYDPEV